MTRRITGQSLLASFQELLRPIVIEALGDPFAPTQRSNALLTAQAGQDNADLLFRRIMFACLATDTPDQAISGIFRCSGFLSAFLVPRPFRAAFLAEVLRSALSQAVLNSVQSTHMRCMMTASFLAKAILARFAPRRTATRIAPEATCHYLQLYTPTAKRKVSRSAHISALNSSARSPTVRTSSRGVARPQLNLNAIR